MGNLFRCPNKTEKREYIMKAVGIVQNGYTAIPKYHVPYTDGENTHGTYWAEANNSGETFVLYEFDATNWNKLHVNQAYLYFYSREATNRIGVSKRYFYIEDIKEGWVYQVLTQTKTDYVIDISAMTGTRYFFIQADSDGEWTTARAKAIVEGDVYLST